MFAGAAVARFIVLRTCGIARSEGAAVDVPVRVLVNLVSRRGRYLNSQVPRAPFLHELVLHLVLEGERVGAVCAEEVVALAGVGVEILRREEVGCALAGGICQVRWDVVEGAVAVGDEHDGHGEVVAVD